MIKFFIQLSCLYSNSVSDCISVWLYQCCKSAPALPLLPLWFLPSQTAKLIQDLLEFSSSSMEWKRLSLPTVTKVLDQCVISFVFWRIILINLLFFLFCDDLFPVYPSTTHLPEHLCTSPTHPTFINFSFSFSSFHDVFPHSLYKLLTFCIYLSWVNVQRHRKSKIYNRPEWK